MKALLSFVRRYSASFAVYFLIGGLSAVVEWAAFYAALSFFGMHYIPASACGFAVATYVNYLLSARIGFKKGQRSTRSEVALIYAVSGIGFVINVAFMASVVEVLGLPVMIGKIGGTGIAFIWNFGARQFCVFDKEPRWMLGRAKVQADKVRGNKVRADNLNVTDASSEQI
jgi:putative flippase GtrA